MKCPVCPGVTLIMTVREGVEIDYCPNCRGVWLDRGELDKIIERSAGTPRVAEAYSSPQARAPEKSYKKRRGGLLDELFDF
ncbi:MAG: zf-TFIIB domain-containing protein [Pseudomonadota bacterium]